MAAKTPELNASWMLSDRTQVHATTDRVRTRSAGNALACVAVKQVTDTCAPINLACRIVRGCVARGVRGRVKCVDSAVCMCVLHELWWWVAMQAQLSGRGE